jgi:hypothetical protein
MAVKTTSRCRLLGASTHLIRGVLPLCAVNTRSYLFLATAQPTALYDHLRDAQFFYLALMAYIHPLAGGQPPAEALSPRRFFWSITVTASTTALSSLAGGCSTYTLTIHCICATSDDLHLLCDQKGCNLESTRIPSCIMFRHRGRFSITE